MLVLELFCGTGSVGKVCKAMGVDVISLDMTNTYSEPTILCNILDWDYKSLNRVPDFIWASPPCNSFSFFINGNKNKPSKLSRDLKTLEPLNDVGRNGNNCLDKVIEIIMYFTELNKDLKFVIENPVGYMRRMEQVKYLDYTDTTYCNYNDKLIRFKPTSFFNNFKLKLKDKCNFKKADHIHGYVNHLPLNEKYAIPQELILEIFNQVVLSY